MSSLKISANTSEVKKSLLDLGRDVKNLGKTKVSVFSERDRQFIKGELNKELGLMKNKLGENRSEISKLVKEQQKLEKGSKAELDQRKKIISAYRTQTQLAKQIDQIQKQSKDIGGFGGIGGSSSTGGIAGMIGKLGSLMGGAALALGGLGVVRGVQGFQQFSGGVKNRVRLKGLGVGEDNFGSPEELAAAGLTEQDAIRRRMQATARLGRAGGSQESMLQQAKFERAYGLEEGSMMNISGALRGSFGGQGADQAQQKLQASILASGIEDAIGPYLEAATDLLSDINKNGMTNTDEMIRIFATMTKDGKRTPEMIAEAFQGIDKAVRGATGEANAFFQTAFARAGIGGGTVGATRLAMSSGGIFGLSEDELTKRGYSPELIKNMKGAGFMQGAGNRTGAILDQFKKSAGLSGGKNISDVTDINTMVGLSTMANSTLGTEGLQGFDALKMMEQVQNKQMSQKDFETRLQDMKDKKDPQLDRLSKINESAAGILDVVKSINTNLLEALGKSTVKLGVATIEADNTVIQGTGNLAEVVNQTGLPDAAASGAKSARSNLTGGGLGASLYDAFHSDDENARILLRKKAESRLKKNGNMPSPEDDQAGTAQNAQATEAMAQAVEKGMTRAMSAQQRQPITNNNKVNVKVQMSDGKVTNKTHK